MSATTSKPDQRVSISKKQDKSWYIQNANYWIAKAVSLNDKDFTNECINAANGVINDSVFDYVMKPLALDENKLKHLPGKIRNIDFLTPIKEKNIGEYIQLPYQFHVVNNSSEVAKVRDAEVANRKFAKLQAMLAEYMQTGQFNEEQLAQVEKEAQEEFDSWVDEKADKGKKTINYINSLNNFEVERIQRFFYWWATEEFYTHRRIVNNYVIDETISPLEGFPITTSAQFVEDYPGFVYIKKVNIYDVKTKYGNVLSEEDKRYLDELDRFRRGGDLVPGTSQFMTSRVDHPSLSNDSDRRGDDILKIATDGFTNEYYICFVTDTKRNILTYINQLGNTSERVVEDDYVFNPEAGDVNLEEKWIAEAWYQVRIGDETTGIYTKPQPYEVQRYGINGAVKIPFGGKKGLLQHNFLYPIPKRIIGSLALYQIINLQIERTIAKYKGSIELIPKSVLNGSTAEETQDNYFMMMADNRLIYDDSKVDLNTVVQGYRVVGNDAISTYLKTLIDIRELIRQEAWDMANMNSNRYGQAMATETVRNNVSNIQLARLGSVLMIQMFNKALELDHKANLEYAKYASIDGMSGAYTDTTGKITPIYLGKGELLDCDFGVFVIDSITEDNKLKAYQDLAFNASQNGDVELAGEAINADSSAGLRVAIKKFAQANREFQMQMKQMDNDNIKAKIDADNALEDKKHANELESIELKENLTTERELELKKLDLGIKDKIASDKNNTTLIKTEADNKTKIEQTKLKPKPGNK